MSEDIVDGHDLGIEGWYYRQLVGGSQECLLAIYFFPEIKPLSCFFAYICVCIYMDILDNIIATLDSDLISSTQEGGDCCYCHFSVCLVISLD